MKNKTIMVIFLVLLILGLISFLLIEKIPPSTNTRNRMSGIELRIRKYVKDNGKLPPSLSYLPERPGYNNSTKDGWGNEISYHHEDHKVFLASYGKDGKIGGEAENADLSKNFTLEEPNE